MAADLKHASDSDFSDDLKHTLSPCGTQYLLSQYKVSATELFERVWTFIRVSSLL